MTSSGRRYCEEVLRRLTRHQNSFVDNLDSSKHASGAKFHFVPACFRDFVLTKQLSNHG